MWLLAAPFVDFSLREVGVRYYAILPAELVELSQLFESEDDALQDVAFDENVDPGSDYIDAYLLFLMSRASLS